MTERDCYLASCCYAWRCQRAERSEFGSSSSVQQPIMQLRERPTERGSEQSDRTGVHTTEQELLRPRRTPQEDEGLRVMVQVGLRLTDQESGLRR
jgi:hypothetical protein